MFTVRLWPGKLSWQEIPTFSKHFIHKKNKTCCSTPQNGVLTKKTLDADNDVVTEVRPEEKQKQHGPTVGLQ